MTPQEAKEIISQAKIGDMLVVSGEVGREPKFVGISSINAIRSHTGYTTSNSRSLPLTLTFIMTDDYRSRYDIEQNLIGTFMEINTKLAFLFRVAETMDVFEPTKTLKFVFGATNEEQIFYSTKIDLIKAEI